MGGIQGLYNKTFNLETATNTIDDNGETNQEWIVKIANVPCWEQIDSYTNTTKDGKFELIYIHRFYCDKIEMDETADRISFNGKPLMILGADDMWDKTKFHHYEIRAREFVKGQ